MAFTLKLETAVTKIKEELQRQKIEGAQVEFLHPNRNGEVSTSDFGFSMFFKDELNHLRAFALYHNHPEGCRRGYSENLKLWYVTVGE